MPNMLEEVTPRLLAQGLMALRSTCVMPRLVNRDYDTLAQRKGSTVDIPIPSAIPVRDVAPGPNAPNTGDVAPDSISLPLDQWKEASFYLTDKDMKQAMDGTIPMQASAAVSAIADTVDKYILNLGLGAYSATGTPGTTPFSGGKTRDANQAAMLLHDNRTPTGDRRFVISPATQAEALELRAFQDISWNGSAYGIDMGMINHRFGFDWFMDQNVPRHTTSASLTDWAVANEASAGAEFLTIKSGASAPAYGDLFTLAGSTQTYVVKTVAGNQITIAPGLVADVAADVAVTFFDSHILNLAFHRDAIAFATRPLEDEGTGLGNIVMSQVDPVSGLALRLEISRENKRTRFCYDVLFGGVMVRPEFIARVMG